MTTPNWGLLLPRPNATEKTASTRGLLPRGAQWIRRRDGSVSLAPIDLRLARAALARAPRGD